MGASRLLHFAVLILVVVAVTTIERATAASVVIGGAKCADCGRKNMDAEAAFKGLQVAISCKNGSSDKYESKAVGDLDGTGAFSVPIAADLSGTDCLAQLQSATNSLCQGQEPSKIVPLSEGTFVVVAGKTHFPSKECASATICFPCHKKPGFMHKKPMPEYQHPSPDYGTPASGCPSPSPAYGQPAPECPPTDPISRPVHWLMDLIPHAFMKIPTLVLGDPPMHATN
ncbi:hypothetical protein GUJ93_ZPchr0012g20642 [Zizania palustris]|uniref:Proline-rich protein n=1 Tax=Zizania palustris TaxID=103762 RepID=A0A8J5WUJ6_ZIZPA|nr:hypothetical protein GUJ93_ZPchr0012g20642 [Zizania palustris]